MQVCVFLRHKHRNYSRNGFYGYLLKNLIKVVFILIVLLMVFVFLEHHVINFGGVFRSFFRNMNNLTVFLLFAISESFFGLIPPDFFILWARKFSNPWLIISLLAIISYGGGLVSYIIGRNVRKLGKLNEFLNKRFASHFEKIKRWGSVFIILAAMFPIPYSSVCIISGVLNYPLKVFVWLGFARILRFYIYALVLFGFFK